MELSKCKLCNRELEENVYGNAKRNYGVAPGELDICYDCLKTLKKALEEIKLE